MRTSVAFSNTIPDIVSELAYCASTTSEPETAVLLIRAARELQHMRFRVSELEHKANLDSWEKYPDRMGGAFTQQEVSNANAWR